MKNIIRIAIYLFIPFIILKILSLGTALVREGYVFHILPSLLFFYFMVQSIISILIIKIYLKSEDKLDKIALWIYFGIFAVSLLGFLLYPSVGPEIVLSGELFQDSLKTISFTLGIILVALLAISIINKYILQKLYGENISWFYGGLIGALTFILLESLMFIVKKVLGPEQYGIPIYEYFYVVLYPIFEPLSIFLSFMMVFPALESLYTSIIRNFLPMRIFMLIYSFILGSLIVWGIGRIRGKKEANPPTKPSPNIPQ